MQLRALGFLRAQTESGNAAWTDEGTKRKVRFPVHKLVLVERSGTIRSLRGNTEVTSTWLTSAKLDRAVLGEELSAIVVWSHRPGADPTTVPLIPVTL